MIKINCFRCWMFFDKKECLLLRSTCKEGLETTSMPATSLQVLHVFTIILSMVIQRAHPEFLLMTQFSHAS